MNPRSSLLWGSDLALLNQRYHFRVIWGIKWVTQREHKSLKSYALQPGEAEQGWLGKHTKFFANIV